MHQIILIIWDQSARDQSYNAFYIKITKIIQGPQFFNFFERCIIDNNTRIKKFF